MKHVLITLFLLLTKKFNIYISHYFNNNISNILRMQYVSLLSGRRNCFQVIGKKKEVRAHEGTAWIDKWSKIQEEVR